LPRAAPLYTFAVTLFGWSFEAEPSGGVAVILHAITS
jgi:hypothetical protein